MCLSGETPAQGSAHGVRRRDRPICVPTWSALILPLELCRPTSSFRAMPYQGSRRAGRRAGAYMRSVARHGTSKWCRLCSSGTGGSRTTSDFCAAHSQRSACPDATKRGAKRRFVSARRYECPSSAVASHGPLGIACTRRATHTPPNCARPATHTARCRAEEIRGAPGWRQHKMSAECAAEMRRGRACGASTRCPHSAQQR